MKAKEAIALAVALGLIAWPRRSGPGVSYLGRSDLPRGVRNNNPGNIRVTSDRWVGQIPPSQATDPDFAQFRNYIFGVRAMIKLLNNYIAAGYNTVAKIINRYAPPSENDTSAYINFVIQQTGLNPNQQISSVPYLLIKAMATKENGYPKPERGDPPTWISLQQFNEAESIL